MTKHALMLRELEHEIEWLMRHTDPQSGAPMRPDLYTDTRYTGFSAARMLTAYVHPQSRYHASPALLSAITDALNYMEKNKRPSGLFDLSSCNFDSAPDTAFTINAMMDAAVLLKTADVPGRDGLLEKLIHLIETACEGICAGGFHTPNHRWAISAALKTAALLTGRQDFSDRADIYLREGLDISRDGEFAERSTGTYNGVNDDQMIRLYLATGDRLYLEAARSNLEMMLSYFDPDGSVFTFNSTRQDYGQKVWPADYYILYLLVGYLMHDPGFAAYSESMWEMSAAHGSIPGGLVWLMRFPDLETYGEQLQPDPAPLARYSRIFPGSGIGRWKRDRFSVTVLANKPNFLYVQNDTLNLCVSLYGNVCDKRNFTAESIEPTDDGCRLACHMDSWYYLPFDGDGPATSDWWQMDNASTRRRQIRASLDLTVQIHVEEDAVRLSLSAEGLDRVPLRLELGFTPGTLRGEQFLMEARPGGEITVSGGDIEVSSPSGHCLTVSPCFASHHVLGRMGGAFPKAEDRFTVYLTCTSPCTREITIGTRPLFPSTLA